jgi:hypothetical protein
VNENNRHRSYSPNNSCRKRVGAERRIQDD